MSEEKMSVETGLFPFNRVYNDYTEFKNIIDKIGHLTKVLKITPHLMQFRNPQRSSDTAFIEYQYTEQKTERPTSNDRVFPMETVMLQNLSSKTGINTDVAIIHTGPYADEMARSYNALAVTMAYDIFFRNGAYKPETEEGRKILSHEITHVGQFNERRITQNVTEKELENEAKIAEGHEEYNPDVYVTIEINGKDFVIKESEMEEYAQCIADDIDRLVNEQNYILDEKRYLVFLHSFKDWLMES